MLTSIIKLLTLNKTTANDIIAILHSRRIVYAGFCEDVPNSRVGIMVEEYDAILREIEFTTNIKCCINKPDPVETSI